MTSQACTASPYPPHVGSRLVVALAQALQGRGEVAPSEAIRRPETEREAAESARQVALALRTTCRLVASDLARSSGAAAAGEARRAPDLAERLSATATQIGDVLALVDRTTEQMSLLASDALTAARGGPLLEDLSLVASEVSTLTLHTRRANQRVAQRVAALHGAEPTARGGKPVASGPAGSEVAWLEAAPPSTVQAATAERTAEPCPPGQEFCLISWLGRP